MSHAQIATRLSCFALLSAIENDLRDSIRGAATRANTVELLPPDVRKNAVTRWEKDNKTAVSAVAESDLDLLPYTDFADLAKIARIITPLAWGLTQDAISTLATRLEQLAPVRNRVCHSRPLEPSDFADLYDFAQWLPLTYPSLLWPETASTMNQHKQDPRFVLSLRIPEFWLATTGGIQHNLPLPEFDDTGFLGRNKDRREVHRLLASPHPVISVVGEGGVGKTALLLRCLYDLVEATDAKYEAIIWVSLKTRMLTATGISEIEDAIASTLGVVQTVAAELGTPDVTAATTEALVDDIREYLEQFRIVLAIDNFETLTKEALYPLLASVPPGSKIALTSRVGLGEIELRYPLEPLESAAAVFLMRRYAQTLNLRTISEAKEPVLSKYVGLLFLNPLLIKWFVSSIASGADPGRLLDKAGEPFLRVMQFCFENLFERLGDVERDVIHALASARHPLSQGELFFLLQDRPRQQVEWALNTLHQSSILRRVVNPKTGAATVTDYTLSDMAAEYVAKTAPPTASLFTTVQARLKELRSMAEAEALQRRTYKYEIFNIRATTRDERICAAYLRQALTAERERLIDRARKLIDDAREFLPTYSEVYRVAGLVYSLTGDLYRASGEFETAIDLAPESSIALYTYAHFLLNELHDFERAVDLLGRALRLDPGDSTLETALALGLTRLGRYPEAAALYEKLLVGLPQRDWKKWRVVTTDQAAECYRRWAEQAGKMSDHDLAVKYLKRSLDILSDAFKRGDFDDQLVKRLGRVIDEAMHEAAVSRDAALMSVIVAQVQAHADRLQRAGVELHQSGRFVGTFGEAAAGHVPAVAQQERPAAAKAEVGDVIRGAVRSTTPGTFYGFIRDEAGHDWFFHRNHLRDVGDWPKIHSGTDVSFVVGQNARGQCAMEVALRKSE